MYWFEQSFTGLGPEDRCYHVLFYVAKSSFLDFIGRFVFFFLQEAESKCTLALQYNSKMGSYYVSRARTRYRLEVCVNCVIKT